MPKTAAIYCRISFDKGDTQVGVARQEQDCRETAARLGYEVPDDFVFIDHSRSAWQRNRKRPGWDAMLERLTNSEFDAVIAYHPDRLMRQPRDLEDLIDGADLSTRKGRPVALVGQANDRDLSNSDDVFVLRIEIAQAAKSSDDTSRRVKSALVRKAAAGRVHGGRRAFGYKPGNMEVFEPEAQIIRDIAGRLLNGEPVRRICRDLNEDGVLTANGKQWSNATLWALMTGPRVAGMRQHQGKITGVAQWPSIIDPAVWQAIRTNSDTRASAYVEGTSTTRRHYLLRGLLRCSRCDGLMTGEIVHGRESYRCRKQIGTNRCGSLRIMAAPLERALVDLALSRLENVTLSVRSTVVIDEDIESANCADKDQIKQFTLRWAAGKMDQDTHDAAVEIVQDRIAARLGDAPKARPSLTGLTGAGARTK